MFKSSTASATSSLILRPAMVAGLLWDGLRARSSPLGLRRAHAACLIGTLVLLLQLRTCAVLAWRSLSGA